MCTDLTRMRAGLRAPTLTVAMGRSRPSVGALAAALLLAVYCGGGPIVAAAAEGAPWPPIVETPDPFLTTPAEGALWEIPVLILSYLPTTDGVHLDPAPTGYECHGQPYTLDEVRQRIMRLSMGTKFGLEEGSRFRNYRAAAPPSIGFRVVDMITVLEPVPPAYGGGDPAWNTADFNKILTRFGIADYVTKRGVKEVWLWMYHHNGIAPVESNMSSPLTGDISNSYRLPKDMPVLDRTYTVYSYNLTRDIDCAMENHMHQYEAILSYVGGRQKGARALFGEDFVGTPRVLGRCGSAHMPPNTSSDYDWRNTTTVASEIEDWRPDHKGAKTAINCDRWMSRTYDWPEGTAGMAGGAPYWFIYWNQSFPGRGNRIPHPKGWMTNWWAFVGDWDGSIKSGLGLYAAQPDDGGNVAVPDAQSSGGSAAAAARPTTPRAGGEPTATP